MSPHVSSEGHRYIVNVVDVHSRKVWLRSLTTKTAAAVARAFEDVLLEAAPARPRRLMSDNGTEVRGAFKDVCAERGIMQSFTRSHAPQSNGIVERANQEVRRLLRALVVRRGTHANWRELLPAIERHRNESVHTATRARPDDVWTGIVRANVRSLRRAVEGRFAVGD